MERESASAWVRVLTWVLAWAFLWALEPEWQGTQELM